MKLVEQEKVELIQRSEAWHELRSKKIGASDAVIICGVSPWKTATELWMEKLKKRPQQDSSMNFAIQRGVRLEPLVLAMANIHLDRDYEPATFIHATIPYFMASLDGWDEERGEAIEIKVGNKKDHELLDCTRENGPRDFTIPEKYYPQLQQQMFVKDLSWMHYVSYYLPKQSPDDRGDLKIVKVLRDQCFLDRYLPVAESFYQSLISDHPPENWKILP